MFDEELCIAKLAYEAYAKVTDWKNFRGDPMPQFDDLPEKIIEAWKAAIVTAREYTAYAQSPQ